jgi:hypothetical protein
VIDAAQAAFLVASEEQPGAAMRAMRRSRFPIGGPGPTWVRRSLFSFDSISNLFACTARSALEAI